MIHSDAALGCGPARHEEAQHGPTGFQSNSGGCVTPMPATGPVAARSAVAASFDVPVRALVGSPVIARLVGALQDLQDASAVSGVRGPRVEFERLG